MSELCIKRFKANKPEPFCALPVNVGLQILHGAEEDLQQQGRLANLEYEVCESENYA